MIREDGSGFEFAVEVVYLKILITTDNKYVPEIVFIRKQHLL
jgi:hypothetical protein